MNSERSLLSSSSYREDQTTLVYWRQLFSLPATMVAPKKKAAEMSSSFSLKAPTIVRIQNTTDQPIFINFNMECARFEKMLYPEARRMLFEQDFLELGASSTGFFSAPYAAAGFTRRVQRFERHGILTRFTMGHFVVICRIDGKHVHVVSHTDVEDGQTLVVEKNEENAFATSILTHSNRTV